MAALWVDQMRRHFMASAHSSLTGMPYDRISWRQEGDRAKKVLITMQQPDLIVVYYSACAQIDSTIRLCTTVRCG